jgi:hypothetical protein
MDGSRHPYTRQAGAQWHSRKRPLHLNMNSKRLAWGRVGLLPRTKTKGDSAKSQIYGARSTRHSSKSECHRSFLGSA